MQTEYNVSTAQMKTGHWILAIIWRICDTRNAWVL